MTSRLNSRLVRCSVFAALTVLVSCTDPISDAPQFEATDCRRVGLIDVDTGQRVVGTEDVAVDYVRNRIFVSAYDRRRAESAARRRAFSIPEGGLYSVELAALRSKKDRLLPVQSIVARSEIAGGLRPHGVDFDASSNEVVFINRGYQKINRKWRMTPRLERVGAGGEKYVGVSTVSPCAANDVLVVEGGPLVTFDHGSCGVGGTVETVFGVKRSGIANEQGEKLFKGALFANGLAVDATGRIVLAATREKSIHFFEPSGSTLEPSAKLNLAGGPDNLSVAPSGDIIAAVHPSMISLAVHRKLGLSRSPSRILEIPADGKAVSTLFDDPGGKMFSAASVGVKVGEMLVIGSATDSGLLVCEHSEKRREPKNIVASISTRQTKK